MADLVNDNRFDVIGKAKEHLLEATNIETSPDEMAVLDSFLFRCWQMGWLDMYCDPPRVIARGVYEQMKFERDVALSVLEKRGIKWEPGGISK